MTQLNSKVGYSKVKTWRGTRAVVDFGTINMATIETCRADYAIFSHYDRYVAERATYPKEAAMYELLARGGAVMAIFRPKPGEIGGPVVRVIKLGPQHGTGRPTPLRKSED
jgi:hypothetical protein